MLSPFCQLSLSGLCAPQPFSCSLLWCALSPCAPCRAAPLAPATNPGRKKRRKQWKKRKTKRQKADECVFIWRPYEKNTGELKSIEWLLAAQLQTRHLCSFFRDPGVVVHDLHLVELLTVLQDFCFQAVQQALESQTLLLKWWGREVRDGKRKDRKYRCKERSAEDKRSAATMVSCMLD